MSKKSRSQFYVDTPPLGRDLPSQRHSMYVSQSEVDHYPKQDLSSASSSATLPSTAGSVDRLTGLGEKKNPRFFTLKPKTSFSLRPFFSSTSSLSPSKKNRRKSIETTYPLRDSYVQTDQDDRAYDEVGVQTLNASTVDVPVQTCFREWEEDDRYSYYSRRPFAVGAHRPGFYRLPSAGYSSSAPTTPVLKPTKSEPSNPASTKNSVVAPLVSSKLLKYAAPGDSSTSHSEKTLTTSGTQHDVNNAITAKPQETSVVSTPQPAAEHSPVSKPTSSAPLDTVNSVFQVDESVQKSPKSEKHTTSLPPISEDNKETYDNTDEPSEVSSGIRVISHAVNVPPSVLKVERTDSPVRHSAKIKTVHFDLSDSESPKQSPKIEKKSIPRNIDKDFIALLKDLDILTDNSNEPTDDSKDNKLKISFNAIPESAPKQTILSSKLRSAFDILHQDVLPPILEHSNETSEVEPQVPENSNEELIIKPETTKENDSRTNVPLLQPKADSAVNLQENICSSPPTELDKDENKLKAGEGVSPKSTSPIVFTSSKSDLDAENCNNRENVYDNIIKRNTSENVSLPTLPSFFDSSPKYTKPSTVLDVVEKLSESVVPFVPVTDNQDTSEEKMFSRSSSRSSVRSNSRSDFNPKQFDSCENLEQLEEEIIKSLCDPIIDNFDTNIMAQSNSPATFENRCPSAAQMRSAILDRLLSGESADAIIPSKCAESPNPYQDNTLGSKHIAVSPKFQNSSYDSPFQSPVPPQTDSFKNYNPVKNVVGTPKNNSAFLFPENNALRPGVAEQSAADAPLLASATNAISDGNFSNISLQSTPVHPEISEKGSISDDPSSKNCDFTNCLRPSELQNSPFLNKISSSSMAYRVSPEKVHTQLITPAPYVPRSESNESKVAKPNGQCDYASCLKPSQVQNSLFTAELSELTANKHGNDVLRTNSPLTARTNSPIFRKSSSSPTVLRSTENIVLKEKTPEQEKSHKSEVTIILKTPEPNKTPLPPKVNEEILDDGVIELPPVFSTKKEPLCNYSEMQSVIQAESPTNMAIELVTDDLSQVPPPPPPPPPPVSKLKTREMNSNTNVNSLESMIRNAQSNLVKTETPTEPKLPAPKTPVMMELEKHFETQRRYSADAAQNQDRRGCAKTELVIWPSPVKRTVSNGETSYMNQTSPNATTDVYYKSNGYSTQTKERSSSLPNGKSENAFNGRDHSFSSKTILTDEPPPPGAVLLDKKVTVDGDKVHTDKYYAIPVKEMLKETTTTTKFIPAPPKYEGIGPTEDGIPIGLRNSVKKENMHNWYKTMFKSLHKVDSALDGQEYTVGYSSEPETSRKDKSFQKKSATLGNRSGNNSSKTTDSLYKQNYPPSAKSSIEVYNVRPRLIEDYEPGNSSVTDDEITYGSKRYLPPLNAPKPSYEFKNGYEQENNFIRNLSLSDGPDPEQQKVWYKEIQKGGDVPQFGLGKPAPERPKEPVIGPLPPPPLNYNGPTICQATRPSTLPPNYTTDSNLCQQSNGPYEIQMRHAIHSEMQHRLSPSSSQLSSPSRSILKSPSRSPDLKLLARALFDFNAESAKEISLKKGDVVLISRQLDKNWYEGEKNGSIGIFPISYVEIVPLEHTSTPIKSFTEGSAKVRYDFTAQTSVELSVKKGDLLNLIRRVDANWYECRFNNKKGIIPASYLQILQEPSEKSALPTPVVTPTPPKSCLKSPRSSSETNSNSSSPYSNNTRSPSVESAIHVETARSKLLARGKKGYSLMEPILYKAIYSYKPQNDDELELNEGDMIYVVEMCDDGWYVGTSVRTGVFGIFPGNYVEKA
ncbi:mucin-2-like isoform X1 [Argiope bruennichi]|uniref:mucin-2-like isoform X1 n=1 Tax=Argiope bruennichi TaxID=94029 RepID=UPI002494B18F|nr:mucin-2-like isoform X1 [Argiope bruennichi]